MSCDRCFDIESTLDQKSVVNDKLCEHLSSVWSASDPIVDVQDQGCAVVLDARTLASSRHLMERHLFDPRQIIVPNPFEYDLIPSLPPDLQGLNLLPNYSGELLARIQGPSTLSLLYLDYTCTISGSKRCRPRSELRSVFCRSLFRFDLPHRKPVLACTFHIPKDQRDAPDKAILQAVLEIEQIAAKFQQQFICIDRFHYENASSSMMMFIIGIISNKIKN